MALGRVFGIGCTVVGMLSVIGCAAGAGDGASGERTSSAAFVTPSMLVTVAPPPARTGPEQVDFDPCTRLGDDKVTETGFDPATRSRTGGVVTDSSTAIGCDFMRYRVVDAKRIPTGLLTVRSSSRTIDEVRADKNWPVRENEVIGGRGAAVYQSPQAPRTCAVAIKSRDGILDIGLVDSSGENTDACTAVVVIARSVVGILDSE